MSLRVAVTVEQSWHPVPGGTATSVVQLLEAMTARDDVQVVGVAARHRRPAPPEFAPPVPVRHLPLPRRLLYPTWNGLRRGAVQRATGPVDVVHATTFAVPPRAGAPLVLTVHDLAFLHAPEHFTAHGVRFFRRGLEVARRDADLVVVPSRQTLDDCLAAGLPAERLRLVPHGVRTLPVAPARVREVLDRHGLRRPYLLWCGTHEPRKNLATLLRAYALVAGTVDVDLVLVGPQGWGPSAPDVDVPADRVHAVGFVPDDELHALYAGARAFCYPSLREGFGMPVLEALSHGLPVVTSTGTPMEDLLDGGGLAVPPLDVTAVADALEHVLGPARDELSALALRAARGRSWDVAADRTVDVYREAVAARRT
ncbi:glycosyltransferase family 4 protein [Thalassiella azotivora]